MGKERKALKLDGTSQEDLNLCHKMLRKTIFNIKSSHQKKMKKSIIATGIKSADWEVLLGLTSRLLVYLPVAEFPNSTFFPIELNIDIL